MSKKSQMEMMGLALIVILISIAMLFVVRFVILEKPAEPKKEFTQTELASNFVNTLLKTSNPDCRGLTFTEILQDVAEGGHISCNIGHGRTDTYLETSLDSILEDTLETWNIAYDFTADTEPSLGEPIYYRENPNIGGCPGVKKSKQFALPIDAAGATTLYVTLAICS